MENISNDLPVLPALSMPGPKRENELQASVATMSTREQVDTYCAVPKLPYGEEYKWQPSLNQAITRRDNIALERLLRKGADINRPDPKSGFCPLVVAASVGSSSQVFHTVLQAKPEVNVSAPSGLKMSAISKCALNGDVNGVKMLLEAGASPGDAPFWEHSPYTIVHEVEDWHPKQKEFKEIQLMLEDAAKVRSDHPA